MKTKVYRLKKGLIKSGFTPDKEYPLMIKGGDIELIMTDEGQAYELVEGELERDFEEIVTPLAKELHTIAADAFIKALKHKAEQGTFRIKVLQTVPPDVLNILRSELFEVEYNNEGLFISW